MTPVDCCTEDHHAIKSSPKWHDLELRGFQKTPSDENGPAIRHEVRNCTCGTTLYKALDPTTFCSECAEAVNPAELGHIAARAGRCAACIPRERPNCENCGDYERGVIVLDGRELCPACVPKRQPRRLQWIPVAR